MEIMSRKAAKEQGSNTYFTGSPCKNGHISYRYTKSGGCSECINGSSAEDRKRIETTRAEQREAMQAAAEVVRRRRETVDVMVEIKLRAYASDLAALRSATHAFAAMRCPVLLAEDVFNPKATDAQGGTALYKARAYLEDVDSLRAVANSLLGAHKVDLSSTLARLAEETPRGVPPPPWTFK